MCLKTLTLVYVWLSPLAVHTITALFVNWLYPNTKKKKKKTLTPVSIFPIDIFLLHSFFPPLSSLVRYRVQEAKNLSLQTNALKVSTSQHISPQAVLQLSRPSRVQQRSGLLPVVTLGVTLKLECIIFTPPQGHNGLPWSESSQSAES